ncbi:LamG domain-containing protein [Streptomyces rhizosphaerihabitans]|uniref:LamG domain-containing protein n=1 Tax=Streptomyces rhizosphaerihabitans TaxID=1266770 RepID=UPI0021C17651|nr:LamG domain-containing protein [Streptomyces rhizosphaerihabitans]MCT9006618.1 LamG domain-containing protein [Streptomyces rhizosphaerihabitans]
MEITSRRNESSELYATPAGKLEAVEHMRPVRARVDGAWTPIDNTLVRNADGTVTPKATATGITFSGGGEGPLVQLEQAGKKLAFSWPKPLPEPDISADTVTYPSVLPDVDLQLRADGDGFHQLLVVNTAQAASNPALAVLKLGVSSPGLTLKESSTGGLEAVDDATGGVAFAAGTPVMWDSSGAGTAASAATAAPSTAKTASLKGASPRTQADGVVASSGTDVPDDVPSEGPADGAQQAAIGVDVSTDGSQLTLTPDKTLLQGDATHFPVYIDPQSYAPKAGDWTMVSKYWASAPQYRFNGDSDAGVGYCGWDYCAPNDTKRLFYKFPTSKFAGKQIIDATFVAHETWSATCDGRSVELWRTKGFTSGTTWNSSSDNWLDHIDTRDVAKGYNSTCAAGDVEFNAIDGVKYAASHDSSYTTFGLRAGSEDDKYGWKRFSDDAYLRVTYNRPPKQIAMNQLEMDPGGACKSPDQKKYVRTLPQVTANNVTDPDGDKVSVQFQAAWDAGDGKGLTAHWTSAKTGYKSSGSDFTISLPSSIPKNQTVDWYARTADYFDGKYWSYSPWSTTGSATGCYFYWDTDWPAGPAITSGDYPKSDTSDPNDPWYDGVGRYGTFTFDVPDTDVTKYWFGINEDPSADNTLLTSGGGVQTMRFRPTRPGLNWVTAEAFDKAGNGSEIRTYSFRVKSGQPARAQWSLDAASGATQDVGTAGERTLDAVGDPALGVSGAIGTAAHFDGVDDYLQSDIPTVDTGNGFSVAAWVKLDRLPGTAAVIAAQPGNNAPGFELYYSKSYDRWVFNQYSADSSTATPVRAMASTGGGVTAGQWVHLAGTYSSTNNLLSLYVNGTLVGTTAYSTSWDARRGLQIGAGSYGGGAAASFFPGTIDEVRIFDKPLAQGEVTDLYQKQPIGPGRPARAVFPLDEPATTGGQPTRQVHGRGDVNPAVFKNGATPGVAGATGKALSLDGVDDYATTGSPHINNQHSFSVVAWAKLTQKPTHAAIVAAQAGVSKSGFELYYSTTYGWSFNQYDSDDANGVPVRAAQGDTTKAPVGAWTQLLGSYDGTANVLRLYVNGQWVASTTYNSTWYAGGPFQIGAARYDGVASAFFPGLIDDVQLYDRALSAPEAQDLYTARPVVQGRWKLDSASGSPAVSPDDLAADQHPLTLGSAASIDATGSSMVGTGALQLDGTSDSYASTSVSPVHTNAGFTASAWVTSPGRPQKPVTVMSMAGANTNGFAVRYVPDSSDPANAGTWQLVMPGSDSTTASASVAQHTNFQNDTSWNHIAVVYDAFAGQIRLYVDGELRQTLCADDDDDGTPNDQSCTETVSWRSNVTPFDATKGLDLGRAKTGATTWGENWSGEIDDVWLMEGVATDTQIAALASGNDLATSPGP